MPAIEVSYSIKWITKESSSIGGLRGGYNSHDHFITLSEAQKYMDGLCNRYRNTKYAIVCYNILKVTTEKECLVIMRDS